MSSMDDLKSALREVLDQRGVLNQLKARIRAEVFNSLDEQTEPKPQPSNINLVINELIREYMEFNRYRQSLSVFIPETGQPEQPPFDRSFLSQQLGVPENDHSVKIPMLYNIVALLQQSAESSAPSSSSSAASSSSSTASSSVPSARSHPAGSGGPLSPRKAPHSAMTASFDAPPTLAFTK